MRRWRRTHLASHLCTVVWCATGHVGARGWERQTAAAASLERIAEIIREKKPGLLRVAVVCLKYGARKAAQALRNAGVQTVLWLSADMLGDSSPQVLVRSVTPSADRFARRTSPERGLFACRWRWLRRLWTPCGRAAASTRWRT